MTAKEIREKSTDALRHELTDQQKHLFDLRSQAVTEKLEDPSQLLKVRRDIARMKTILRQRELVDGGNGTGTGTGTGPAVAPKTERRAARKTDRKAERKTVKRTVKKTAKRSVKKTARKREKAPASE